ncbi:MAG: hypothetical protein AAF403_06430 [Pseudomonadota bacterium]
MFTIPSFGKLLLLTIIILVVWYGFKWLNKSQKNQLNKQDETPMTRACPKCDLYQAIGQELPCKRPECPWK